ncbi:MAG: hypothetical protein M3416_19395 [Acidobacteriota bacterium]|nr:hypothetical protein [Acidobacteriota bacterium]
MLFPALEANLRHAGHALGGAGGQVVGLRRQYLALLAGHRAELYKLPDAEGIAL